MIVVAAALLALPVLACGKDDDTSVAGTTAVAVGTADAGLRPERGQGTAVAASGFETPAPDVTGSSVAQTPRAVGTRLEIESVSGTAGRSATVDITMHEATEGLAGFLLEVSVADPGIARIVGVDLSDFGLSETSPLPATVLSISAVDLTGLFEGPFERETIATLDLELLTAGETEIVLQVLKLDDDEGGAVSAEAVHGRLFVSDTTVRP
jgi:hypothetical protein